MYGLTEQHIYNHIYIRILTDGSLLLRKSICCDRLLLSMADCHMLEMGFSIHALRPPFPFAKVYNRVGGPARPPDTQLVIPCLQGHCFLACPKQTCSDFGEIPHSSICVCFLLNVASYSSDVLVWMCELSCTYCVCAGIDICKLLGPNTANTR